MVGILNKSFQEMVINHFGDENWELALERSGEEVNFFRNNEPSGIDSSYKIAKALSELKSIPVDYIMKTFGEWWIINTCLVRFADFIQVESTTFSNQLLQLPNFHNRLMFLYPNLLLPEIQVSVPNSSNLYLHFDSAILGNASFIEGLIYGISKSFNVNLVVELVKGKEANSDLFKLSW
ncbi:MAG: heme NO-binding domain-containing protein [Bacteroidia bacterium]|nr:heme NO-binding domain-containing protein [Bacteroidia bacterium]